MINSSMKNSHTIASGFLSTGFKKVSKLCKSGTFAFVLGYAPIPFIRKRHKYI